MLQAAANEPEPMQSGVGVAAVLLLLLGLKLPFRTMPYRNHYSDVHPCD
jgi:hypothetical protein